MACRYCGNRYVTAEPFCEGCGSPKDAAAPDPAQEAARVYAQLGRAVLERRSEDVLDWLRKHQPGAAEDARQLWIRRAAKAGVCLLALFLFPQIFFVLPVLLMMFAIWVYLPYRGLRLLFNWLAS